MRHLHFDCFSGISGDMTLGAFLDAGASEEKLRAGLSTLRTRWPFEIKIWKEPRHSILGTRVAVLVGGRDADEVSHHEHSHEHSHHSHEHSHGHSESSFRSIKAMIESSGLSPKEKQISLRIFGKLAAAEGKLHGQDPADVEFHEVGAIDSIVDIVGASILLMDLAPETISASPLPMGHGFVKCRHGRMPIPAPATLELLCGVPVYDAKSRGELVTPTGAAIVSALATTFSRFVDITPEKIGYGIGKNDFEERPNALRVIVGKRTV